MDAGGGWRIASAGKHFMSPCQISGRSSRTPPCVRGSVGIAMENLEPRTFLSITDPDPTFGNGGTVTLPFVPDIVSLEPDGEILAVKSIFISDSQETTPIEVAQVGVNGSVKWDVQVPVTGSSAYAQSVTVQPDGKILVGGDRFFGGSPYWGYTWMTRLNSDGSVDQTFKGATQFYTFGGIVFAKTIAVEPNGEIISAGVGDHIAEMERLAADGSFISDSNPLESLRGNGNDYTSALAVQNDSKLLVAGTIVNSSSGASQLSIARFNADGSQDTSFGSGGLLITNRQLDPNLLQLDPGGDILVASAGDSGTAAAVAGITGDGTLDHLFARKGVITSPAGMDTLTDLQVQPNGTFLVTGTVHGQPVAARFTSAGALDGTLGYNGILEGPGAITGSGTPFLHLTSDNKLVEWSGGSTIQRWIGLSQPQPAIDTLPPIPTLSPLAPVSTGARRYTFSVTYSDLQSGVSAASIASNNVLVYYGHHRWLAATLLSVTPTPSQYGSAMVATYSIRPPDGRWSSRDNATYSIELAGGQVADNDGNATPQTLLGTFEVSIIRRRHVRHREP